MTETEYVITRGQRVRHYAWSKPYVVLWGDRVIVIRWAAYLHRLWQRAIGRSW